MARNTNPKYDTRSPIEKYYDDKKQEDRDFRLVQKQASDIRYKDEMQKRRHERNMERQRQRQREINRNLYQGYAGKFRGRSGFRVNPDFGMPKSESIFRRGNYLKQRINSILTTTHY